MISATPPADPGPKHQTHPADGWLLVVGSERRITSVHIRALPDRSTEGAQDGVWLRQ
jgi:hypothetical protein